MSLIELIHHNLIENGRIFMLLEGLLVTIQISVGAVILGTVIGIVIFMMSISKIKLLKWLSLVYIDVIRGTPVIIQLLIINFTVFSSFRNIGIWVGIITMGINSAAYVAEIIRAGISSVDIGQTEAGRSLGLSKYQTMIFIVTPQALKNVLPALGNEFIVLIKETAIIGYIAVEDLTKMSQIIMSRTMSAVPLFASAVLYFVLIKILTLLLRKFERKLNSSYER